MQWRMAARRVGSVQARILRRTLHENAATSFGREHGFSGIRTVGDYQEHVPVRGSAELEPYIARAAAGERRVLTAGAIRWLALSSGSSASTKLIPYTSPLLGDFRRGITPWLAGLYLEHPSLLFGKSYWQVSPVGTPGGVSSGGIRIGFGEDSEYFGRYRGALVRATLAVPEHVAGIADMDVFRFETLRHLLACRNLRFISVWNPSFLTLLLAEVRSLAPALIQRIGADGLVGRAAELQGIFDEYKGAEFNHCGSSRTLGEAIWRKLRVISCWSDAGACEAALRLQAAFPSAIIQPKGLIATEGMMSVPWRADGAALALRSHFFEFLEAGSDNPKLAHELETGRIYSIIMTTSGGLYRYRIGDLVEVTGWIAQCPLLRFRGKESDVSDMAGEKLNGVHVTRAAEQVFARFGLLPDFWMVAPERGDSAPWYTLYIQSKSLAPDGLVSALEAALGENFHYAYARRLGQLAPLKLFPIDPASAPETDYLKAQAANGRRLGGIKRSHFDRTTGWSEVFKKDVSADLS
jgi:GH3 auxin-responsive promoter